MDQRIINLFDEYTHKPLSRNEFISRLAGLTGSISTALAILPKLEINYGSAITVAEDDSSIEGEDVTYEGDGYAMKAYYVKPQGTIKTGSVIVIHENRGLNPHIRDVARRVAKAGYLALAPDALSAFGGTPDNEEEARGLFSKIDAAKNLNSFIKGFALLNSKSGSNGKTGCVGFCWGGALVNQMAIHDPNLDAAVAFYGRQPDAVDVSKIKAHVQLHYGGLDERINAGIATYESALKAASVRHEIFVYEGVQHAFHNDTAPTRYNEAAAKLAWQRTLDLFKKTLS